jgi:6-O-methylguanine DNA methyltransferase, DNA binding domain
MMIQEKDEIVDIPADRVRYFGTTGKMLLPSPATIANIIKRIPASKLLTTDLLRQHLTEQFNVQGTCPVTTKNSLRALVSAAPEDVAYWRVIRPKGELMSDYPGGVTGHASHLQDEGFSIDTNGKAPKVKDFREKIVHF